MMNCPFVAIAESATNYGLELEVPATFSTYRLLKLR